MSLTLDARSFTVEPLSPILGAAISGLDLREALNDETRRTIYDAFVRYHVLCFRDQHLNPEQQIAFTEQFGTLERHMARNRGTGNPLVHIVSNLGADGKPSGKVASTGWHSDKSFRPEPSLATILHAQIMPPEGGETCFANMIALPMLTMSCSPIFFRNASVSLPACERLATTIGLPPSKRRTRVG